MTFTEEQIARAAEAAWEELYRQHQLGAPEGAEVDLVDAWEQGAPAAYQHVLLDSGRKVPIIDMAAVVRVIADALATAA